MKFCSIIVVHYAHQDIWSDPSDSSRSDLFKVSLESLITNTDYPAEIIVMDNGGNPDDTDYLVQKVRDGAIQTLVRYRDNMHFAFAWNQGARIATGDYLCFACNDIRFRPKWLSSCIGLLEKYSDRKLIATPYITPDKNRPNFNKEILSDARINSMAGSNCMVMPYTAWREIGEFPHHRIGGSIWHRMMVHKGYMAVIPLEDLAEHLAYRKGVNWKKKTPVERTLLGGEKVDFHYFGYEKSIYRGQQRKAGREII